MKVDRFLRKWLKDLAVSHSFTGAVPFFIPTTFRLPVASSGWGDAAIIVPWIHFLMYGDKRILVEQYGSMKKWFRYESASAAWPKLKDLFHMHRYFHYERYLWDSGFHFGDWLAPGEDQKEWMAKKPWIATAYYAQSARLLANIAHIIGHKKESAQFLNLFEKIRTAFCDRFLGPGGVIVDGFQAAYALALEFDLLAPAVKPASAQHLADDILRHGDHLTTGFLGTPPLNFALSNNSQTETAYRLLLQDTCPSWLYPVTSGATTIWERWDAIRHDGSINESAMGNDNMVSFNHYAFGAIGDWLYRVVAGLDIDPEIPGYKHILIQPQPGGGLEHAEASFHSMYGSVITGWKITGSLMKLIARIPPNTTAQIALPHALIENIHTIEGLLVENNDYRNLRQQPGTVFLEVGSGYYEFEWKME